MVARFLFALVAAAGVLGVAVFLGAGAAVVWVGVLSFILFLLVVAPDAPRCDTCGRVVSHLHGDRWRCDRCDREQDGPNFDAI
jgi:tRNA(Ile2) C34 agmatinyltransferase TiaS